MSGLLRLSIRTLLPTTQRILKSQAASANNLHITINISNNNGSERLKPLVKSLAFVKRSKKPSAIIKAKPSIVLMNNESKSEMGIATISSQRKNIGYLTAGYEEIKRIAAQYDERFSRSVNECVGNLQERLNLNLDHDISPPTLDTQRRPAALLLPTFNQSPAIALEDINPIIDSEDAVQYAHRPVATRTSLRSPRSRFSPGSPFSPGSRGILGIGLGLKLTIPLHRCISTNATVHKASAAVVKLVAELSEKIPDDKRIPATTLKRISQDFRDLENLITLEGKITKSQVPHKDAQMSLCALLERTETSKDPIYFKDLKDAVPMSNYHAWKAIEERLLTNQISQLAALSDTTRAVVLFLQIYAVGPVAAKKFAAAGARTLKDLSTMCELTKAQKLGVKHFNDINRMIPRSEMKKIEKVINIALSRSDLSGEILGSFRRNMPYSSDVDLALRHPSVLSQDDALQGKALIQEYLDVLVKEFSCEVVMLSHGDKKFAGLIKIPGSKHFERIDIRMVPSNNYPYVLLGGTGDALLMKYMRWLAKRKGWCLNEYGMGEKYDAADQNPNGFKPNTLQIVENEAEIFELLGLPYLEPHQRVYSTYMKIFKAAGKDVLMIDKL